MRTPNHLPNHQQELLLRAALLDNRDALDQWLMATDIPSLDPASVRLLPLLQPKLKGNEFPFAVRKKIEEVYAQTRMTNRLMLSDLQSLLQSFDQAGIETLLLKGSALIHSYYRDPGLRPMVDLDVLVPTQKASSAIQLLSGLGYGPEEEKHVTFSERLIPALHGYAFCAKSRTKVDLHWHVLAECLRDDDDLDFWKESVEIQMENATSRVLNPADQILHLCVHGCKWSIPSSIRWVADVLMVLNSNKEIEWHRLTKLANQKRVTAPITEALAILRERFGAKIPAEVFDSLHAPSKTEISEFRYKMNDHQNRLLGNLPLLWYSYKRTANDANMRGFLGYLQQFWGVKKFWQLPFVFVKRFLRRMERRL